MSSPPATVGVAWDARAGQIYPVRYDVLAVERHSRLRVAFRMLLALPHLIALYICFYLAQLITIPAWLIGVFSGQYDPGLAALPTACLRWEARVLTYVALLRDEYPPFSGGDYPMQFDVPLQTRQGRASIFFRALLVLPHLVVLYLLWTVWTACVALAWFALLITARYPEGLRRLVIGINRWQLRVVAYMFLLRGDYPPFSLGLNEQPPAPPSFAAPLEALAEPTAGPSLPPTEPAMPPISRRLVLATPPQPIVADATPHEPERAASPPADAAHGSEAPAPQVAAEAREDADAERETSPENGPSFFRPRRPPQG